MSNEEIREHLKVFAEGCLMVREILRTKITDELGRLDRIAMGLAKAWECPGELEPLAMRAKSITFDLSGWATTIETLAKQADNVAKCLPINSELEPDENGGTYYSEETVRSINERFAAIFESDADLFLETRIPRLQSMVERYSASGRSDTPVGKKFSRALECANAYRQAIDALAAELSELASESGDSQN